MDSYIERILILTFVLVGSFEGVGFLLAAKSVFRFGELNKAKEIQTTEYVLIGTFAMFHYRHPFRNSNNTLIFVIPLDNIDFSKNIENFLNEYMINPDPILCGRAAKVGKTLTRFLSATLNRHWGYVYFTFAYFLFHVSFLCFNLLIINAFIQ